jgi:hypothetical protein
MQKIIHRIFFNFDNTPDPFLPYLETWKQQLPDFEIKLWDKNNLPLDLNPYTKYMAEKKNHAFLSDYFRCWLLNKYGGVYLDADIEILNGDIFRNIYEEAQATDDYTLFIGIESERNGKLTAHSMGLKYGESHELLIFLMNLYETVFSTSMRYFIKKFPITDLISLYFRNFEENGYSLSSNGFFPGKQNVTVTKKIKIYPQDYFSPITDYNNDMMISAFSKNTCICHHFAATWKASKNTTQGKLFLNLLKNNYYVLPPNLIPTLKDRYDLPNSFRKPLWALNVKEIAALEKKLNQLLPYGGILYSCLRKLRKRH